MSFFSSLVSVILLPCAAFGLLIKFVFSLICCSSPSRRVVGIFSRSASDNYMWLTNALNSAMFKNVVKESRSIYISNREYQFRQAVPDCDFVILYHTKNHGRINLTNVTDSLYDKELWYMWSCKGRANVMVLVDDLDKGDYEEKRRIMDAQPDIMKYSQDLMLVSSTDKRQPQLLERKLQDIKALISTGSWDSMNFCEYLVSMVTWVYTNVAALCGRIMTYGGRGGGGGDLNEPLLA